MLVLQLICNELLLKHELIQVESRLEAIGAATARVRVKKLLKNLGFSDALLARRMNQLSGGWRVRRFCTVCLCSCM